MATYTKHVLSGSTNGRPIQINVTAATGTIIHTAGTGTTDVDEIWVWVTNTATESRDITLEHGGTATSDTSVFTVPSRNGLYLISPGLILNNGLISRMYATASETLNAVGYVNRIAT
jgi:hypothetical protein